MILSKLWMPIGYFMAYICLKIGFYKSKAKKGKTKGQGADFALSPPAGSKNRQPAQGTKRKAPKKAQPPPRCALSIPSLPSFNVLRQVFTNGRVDSYFNIITAISSRNATQAVCPNQTFVFFPPFFVHIPCLITCPGTKRDQGLHAV